MFTLTAAILRNLAAPAATRRYPAAVREPFAGVRGEIVNDIAACVFCGRCALQCPSQCLTVDKEAGVWTCDPFACVFCGLCVDICPAKSLLQRAACCAPCRERRTIRLQGTPRKKKDKPSPAAKES